jgi:hypothetical protein
MGRIQNEFRPPLCAPTEEHLSQLKAVLETYELF